MKKLICMLLAMLLFTSAAFAETHILMLGQDGGKTLLFDDAGNIIVSLDQDGMIVPVDEENGWYGISSQWDHIQMGDYALMNSSGEVLTEESYVSLCSGYSDRIIFAKTVDETLLCGLLNEQGEEIVPATYADICADGAGGFYATKAGDDRLIRLDRDGVATDTGIYAPVSLMEDFGTLFPARKTPDGKIGYVNSQMEWVIEPQFTWASYFTGNVAVVWDEEFRFGVTDEGGNAVLPMEYAFIAVGNSLIADRLDENTCDVFDRSGALRFTYEGGTLQECGELFVGFPVEGTTTQLLDSQGKLLREVNNEDGVIYWQRTDDGRVLPFINDALTGMNFLLDETGVEMSDGYLQLNYAGTTDRGDLFVASTGGMLFDTATGLREFDWASIRFGVVDAQGNSVVPFEYLNLFPLSGDGLLCFEDQYGSGVLTLSGEEILRFDREGKEQ